jgi:acetyl esterase
MSSSRVIVVVVVSLLVSAVVPAAVSAPGTSAGQGGAAPDVRFTELSFMSGGTAIPLDAYLPAGAPAARPAVIYVHGGGWRDGSLESLAGGVGFAPTARRLVRAGFVVLSVGYRLAPEHPFPAGGNDVSAAVRWVRANAVRLGVAPDRIGLLGNSAGGTLAAFAATRGRGPWDAGSRVAAVVSWSGPMALSRLAGSLASDERRSTMVSDYLGCDPSECGARAKAASPVHHVDSTDPPMLLANSLDEFIPPGQASVMARQLRQNHVPYTLVLLPGKAHAAQFEDRVWARMLRFLHRHLG